jgi:Secretion system C-terminal sorting domain
MIMFYTQQPITVDTEEPQITPFEDVLSIAPNPASQQLTWLKSSNGQSLGSVQVTNLLGKVMYQQKVNGTSHALDVSAWPIGVYMVQTLLGTRKLMVVK